MSRDKKIVFASVDPNEGNLFYIIDTSGYGDFNQYVMDRMEGNKPIQLKVVDYTGIYDVVVHPAFYSQYVMEIRDYVQ